MATREAPTRFTEDEIRIATRFILFAAWADELAGNDVDPRLAELSAPPAPDGTRAWLVVVRRVRGGRRSRGSARPG